MPPELQFAQADELKADLREEVRQEFLAYYLTLDSAGKLINAPKTDDELWEFIKYALSFEIPRKRIDPNHRAPFEFVADLYFERVKNALGFANRNGGKTLDVAILNALDTLFKPGCEVASAGAVLDQANKCYRYFRDFLEMDWFKDLCERYHRTTGRKYVVKAIQSWTEFATGSKQEVVTASEKGLRSPHPNKARIDEIDLIDWKLLQTGLSMSHSSKGIRGQNVFTSTRQNEHGSMQRLLDEAEEKGIAIYEWNIWETLERCDRRCFEDPEHGSCPVYQFCQGKAHECAGFYKIDDFIDKVRLLDKETWEVEWLNSRPSRHQLVYHMFDNTRHVMTPQRLHQLTGFSVPQLQWGRVGGLDFGSSPGHPFVYIKVCQLPNNAFLAFYEYVAEQRLMRDHADAIKRSPYYMPGERIYADWSAQDRLELKNLRVRTRQAKKDVLMGIDHIKSLLTGFLPSNDPMLYVWHECTSLLEKFGLYKWPTRPDGKPDRSGKPLKQFDDELDALRYALYSDRGGQRPRYRARTVAGI